MTNSFWFPIQLSLLVAVVAAILVFIVGICVSRLFVSKRFKGKLVWETVFMLPLVLPPSVVGYLLILFFGTNSIVGQCFEKLLGTTLMFTPWANIIAASVVAFPLMFQSANIGFESISKDVIGAARVDGASELCILIKIMLPMAGKALMTGAILSFTRALGEFGATLMFAGNIPGKTETIPTAIYVAIESGENRLTYLYVLISICTAFILLVITNSFKRYKY
ncbi:putative molybdenum transport system permease protein YvgM [Pullulanibacillus camelliae]|uniref:Molybdenum transport system permease n=1 Tax=Pullulanibacillus camelliae TaxID=1707096 RepID=A0A8J2YLC8_9BACL|nr:molybdate ABC transporter permease subunit [Pullulanibacillus camelliae]GGE50470.1 putative molybdenum transport system permease protein YvgM [Pullulanibacillus camelliae]